MDDRRQSRMTVKRALGNGGSVLVIALLLTTLLTIIGIGFLSVSGTEISIAFNESHLQQAFYLGEAGVAEATRVLRDSDNWNTVLAAAQPFNCPGLVPDTDGGCTFTIVNDAADPGGPLNDTNDIVVVTSSGTFRNAARDVEAGLTRLALPMPAGAITSIGASTNVSFAGNAFTIDGNNWVPPSDNGATPESQDNGTCGSVPVPKYGVAVPDAGQQVDVYNDLNFQQMDNITGDAPDPPWNPPSSDPSIGVDTTITPDKLAALVDMLIPMADHTYTPGSSFSAATIGTQADPKLVVVDATDYSGTDPALSLHASSGVGILIVKNGGVRFTGNFQWEGLVIVLGDNVEIDMRGGGHKTIYGSVLLSENLQISTNTVEGDGNVEVKYSCEAINTANQIGGGQLRGARLWWREMS